MASLDALERLLRESTADGFVHSGVSLAIAQILGGADHNGFKEVWGRAPRRKALKQGSHIQMHLLAVGYRKAMT